MQEAFLELVKEGDVEEVKLFLQMHASYQSIESHCNRNTPTGVESLTKPQLNLTPFKMREAIQSIQNIPHRNWDNIAYKTWFELGPKLESSIINKALLIACEQGNAPMVSLLLRGGFNRNPVVLIKSTSNLLSMDSDLKKNYLDFPGYSIQFTAANPNSNLQGATALELAVASHSEESVKYLLLRGARATPITWEQCAPLIPALLKQATESEKYCLTQNWTAISPHLFRAPLWTLPLGLPRFVFEMMMSVAVPFTKLLFRSTHNTVEHLEAPPLIAPSAVIPYPEEPKRPSSSALPTLENGSILFKPRARPI